MKRDDLTALIVLGGFVIIVTSLGVLAAYLYWRSSAPSEETPQFVLEQVANAIDAHDEDLFDRYVDMDSLLEPVVDQTMAQVAAEELSQAGKDGIEAFAMEVAKKLFPFTRPMIKKKVSREMAKAILSDAPVPLSQLIRRAEVKGIERSDGATTVSLEIGIDEPISLSLILREQSGHQQIVAIANLLELLESHEIIDKVEKREEVEKGGKGSQEREAAQNQPVRDEINRSLVLTGATLERRNPDAQGRNSELYLALRLVNTGDEEIVDWSGTLYFIDLVTGHILHELDLGAGHRDFYPLSEERPEWSLNRGEDLERDDPIWTLPKSTAFFIAEEIVFASGRKLSVPHPDVPQVRSPAHVAVLNRGCGQLVKLRSPEDAVVVGAIGYPYEWSKDGEEYEITSELVVGPDGTPVRKKLQCWGTNSEEDLSFREIQVDGTVVYPVP